ncbi:hypothetical protein Tco_0399676 [Tanacetum coccineum]
MINKTILKPLNFDSDDEDDEPTPQPKTHPSKPVKETPLPKPYKPKIPYPQRLRKEKMEAQIRKSPRHDLSRPNQLGAVLEFDIEIKDKKGTENVAANHLSRIDYNESSDDSEVDDNFPGETLMEINTGDEPWFADFSNYLIPKGMAYQQKNKFFFDLKYYFWEEPYLFKVCSDGMIRRCVSGPETQTILDQCHHGPTSGHYRPNY